MDWLALDRSLTLSLNGSESSVMDQIMLLITSTIVWIPVGLVLLFYIYKQKGLRDMLLVLCGIALCILFADFVSSGIVKPLVGRLRPTSDPSLGAIVDVAGDYRAGKYGFFSSHAANTMSVAVFLSLLLRRRTIVSVLLLWSLLNCWSRVYLGVHYVGDILVGILWGMLVGTGVYYILFHTKGDTQKDRAPFLPDVQPIFFSMLLTFAAILIFAPILAA